MSPRPRVCGRRLPAVLTGALLTVTSLVTFETPASAMAVPSAPVTLPVEIEVMPPYQPQIFCDPVVKPGTKALADLLTTTYAGTAVVSLTRTCGSDTSEHYDGRAIDWGVDHRIDKQRLQGKAFLQWLFAADEAGNGKAMLRRLGVMYIIWNKQIWGAWSNSWEPYSCSGATACHVDHMHISLDWSGAEKKTSFWTGIVRDPMPPPLMPIKALHEPVTVTVSARDDSPEPSYKLVAGGKYRFKVSGVYHYDDRSRHRADAECSTADGTTWTKDPVDGTPGVYDLSVNGVTRWRATGEVVDGCSATHTYKRVLTFEERTPLLTVINNPNGWWGDGELTLTVERIG
jgi:hypothetical protein